LEVETVTSNNYYIRLIKRYDQDAPQITDVTEIKSDEGTVSTGEEGSEGITVSTDNNGNTVTENTDITQIQNNTVVQNFVTSVTKTHT